MSWCLLLRMSFILTCAMDTIIFLWQKRHQILRLGGTLDLNSLGISTWRVNGDQKTERNDVVYTLELDENLWYVHPSQDGTFPLLTRMKDYGTNIALIANIKNENGGRMRSAAEIYWFDELDYSVWFENLREEGGTYVFNNEEDYVLQLNTENLADKKDKEEALYRNRLGSRYPV